MAFAVAGKTGSFNVAGTAFPLTAALQLNPGMAYTAGQCGQATFPGTSEWVFNAPKGQVICKP